MKKFLIGIGIVLVNIAVSFFLIRYFVLSQQVIISAGDTVVRDVISRKKTVVIATGATLSGTILLQEGEIVIQDNVHIIGDIFLGNGNIMIGKDVIVQGDILLSGTLQLGASTHIEGNISQNAILQKDSRATISGTYPPLFITTNYPYYLKYFDVLPDNHKDKVGYIYLTSSNMDIRRQDKDPRYYFLAIYHYVDGELKPLDLHNKAILQQHYANTKHYVNKISDTRASRYDIAFATLAHSFDKKKPDIYISSHSANSDLFIHEFGHVMDFSHDYIDYHTPAYPYTNKKHAITNYGKYHKGEDFAEGYRYYVLYPQRFLQLAKDDSEILEKYRYFKNIVFGGKEYFS